MFINEEMEKDNNPKISKTHNILGPMAIVKAKSKVHLTTSVAVIRLSDIAYLKDTKFSLFFISLFMNI